MAFSIGVVVKTYGNGKAEVRLQEQNPGIIGAPDLNVCHCVSPGSIIVTQALNQAGALPGDEVRLEHCSKAILKNVFALILIPLLGIGAGIFFGAALYQKGFLSVSGAIFMSTFSFLFGISIGLFIYKKNYSHLDPVIIDIIKRRINLIELGEE